MKQGKLIVIDGTDGSGKATQVELLVSALKNEGRDVAVADFPQYGNPSAWFVEQYLNGKFGTAEEVGAKRASILYAIDRYQASFQMRKELDQGKIIISNRYVTANMGHQGCKIEDKKERMDYLRWLDNLEHEIMGIPRPDLNIILHVPSDISQKLVDEKGHRDYIGGSKRDLHEADLGHLKKAEQVYLEIAKEFDNFKLIKCTDGDRLMTREEIHKLVRESLEF